MNKPLGMQEYMNQEYLKLMKKAFTAGYQADRSFRGEDLEAAWEKYRQKL